MTSPFQSSYLISTRKGITGNDAFEALPNGEAFYYWAPGQPDPKPYNELPGLYQPDNTSGGTAPPPQFNASLVNDLMNNAVDGKVQLVYYIHGLGNSFQEAAAQYGNFGNSLYNGKSLNLPKSVPTSQTFRGLLVGFDWPTSGDLLSNLEPSTYRQTRANAQASTMAFRNLFVLTESLRGRLETQGVTLEVSVICHSEGNYMMMVGAQQLMADKPTGFEPVKQVVLLAADFNFGGFITPPQNVAVNQGTGTAAAISEMAERVSLYYSSYDYDSLGDKALLYSFETFGDQHNSTFQHRIGRYGPDYSQPQQSNLVGIDCFYVANSSHLTRLWFDGLVPLSTIVHVCYRFVPQILQDIAETLAGVPANRVLNRKAGQNAQDFVMVANIEDDRRYAFLRSQAQVPPLALLTQPPETPKAASMGAYEEVAD